MTRGSPGTMTMRVFQRWPRVEMHHQRSACEAMTSASMSHDTHGMIGVGHTHTSTSAPTSSPMCSTTMNG